MEFSKQIHDIVSTVYTDKRLTEFFTKLKPVELQDDLKGHCVTEIYRIAEKYPGKLEALHEREQVFAWITGMAKMQLMSCRSTFYRKHRRSFADESFIGTMPDLPPEFELPVICVDHNKEWAYKQFDRPKKPLAGNNWQLVTTDKKDIIKHLDKHTGPEGFFYSIL